MLFNINKNDLEERLDSQCVFVITYNKSTYIVSVYDAKKPNKEVILEFVNDTKKYDICRLLYDCNTYVKYVVILPTEHSNSLIKNIRNNPVLVQKMMPPTFIHEMVAKLIINALNPQENKVDLIGADYSKDDSDHTTISPTELTPFIEVLNSTIEYFDKNNTKQNRDIIVYQSILHGMNLLDTKNIVELCYDKNRVGYNGLASLLVTKILEHNDEVNSKSSIEDDSDYSVDTEDISVEIESKKYDSSNKTNYLEEFKTNEKEYEQEIYYDENRYKFIIDTMKHHDIDNTCFQVLYDKNLLNKSLSVKDTSHVMCTMVRQEVSKNIWFYFHDILGYQGDKSERFLIIFVSIYLYNKGYNVILNDSVYNRVFMIYLKLYSKLTNNDLEVRLYNNGYFDNGEYIYSKLISSWWYFSGVFGDIETLTKYIDDSIIDNTQLSFEDPKLNDNYIKGDKQFIALIGDTTIGNVVYHINDIFPYIFELDDKQLSGLFKDKTVYIVE